jgi:hypothetical protein
LHISSPEPSSEGWLATALKNIVHELAPHTHVSLYLLVALTCLAAVLAVRIRCGQTGSTKSLKRRWPGSAAGYAAPIPIYLLLILAPLDDHLWELLKREAIIVALVGLYGILEATLDVRRVAGQARERAIRGEVTKFDD